MLIKIFVRGLVALLPIAICLLVLVKFFTWAETFSRQLVLAVFPNLSYYPGLGIVLGVGVIFALGILMSTKVAQAFYRAIETPFRKFPIIKTIYMAVKDLTQFFSKSDGQQSNKVVRVRWPGLEVEMVGFVTRDNLQNLPEGIDKENRVAVYFPMSYIIGGYTLFVKREWIEEIDMKVEDAMKSTLTAWVTTHVK